MIALGNTKYGEASKLRILKSGREYDSLFEKAPGQFYTVKKDAGLSDTIDLIPKVVRKTYPQTFKISQKLKGSNIFQTCKNIWHFVYEHIQYRKDKQGYEQIRSPRRTWHDKTQGVDCDCYSVFISSILTNLGIPHILRITKYNEDYFQHIYPIVPFGGRYITIDCVTDRFDYEVPYSEKKDYPMELQFLDGIPDYDGVSDLGKLFKKKNKTASTPSGSAPAKKKGLFSKLKVKKAPTPGGSSAPKKKKKGLFKKIGGAVKKINVKKIVSKINKINPAAIAVRNGILAAMKLNVSNVAKRLRWSYLTKEQAASKGIDEALFDRLLKTRNKLEKIFEIGGGKLSNLKKAILGGKGNKDKKVTLSGIDGLGMLPYDESNLTGIYSPLEQVLGPDIYYSENVEGLNGLDAIDGLGQLGEPVTIATVGAAMGVISGIISQLKQIGNIFKGKTEGSEDFDEATNAAAENNEPVPGTTPVPDSATNSILPEQATLPPPSQADESSYSTSSGTDNSNSMVTSDSANDEDYNDGSEEDGREEEDEGNGTNNLQVAKTSNNSVSTNDKDDKVDFWKKPWVKPTAIIGGSLLVLWSAAKALGGNGEKNKSSPGRSLDGIPRKNKKHKRTKKNKKKLAAIELL